MTDWRHDYKDLLIDRQRHISQKLAQLRELRELLKKWARLVREWKEWFEASQGGAQASRYFSMDALMRMSGILAGMQQLIAEFGQLGDPKATGGGGAATAGPIGTSDLEWMMDRAGPLATYAPWELAWSLDPELTGSIEQGELFTGFVDVYLNIFTKGAHFFYWDDMIDLSDELVEERAEEIDALFEHWLDASHAIDDIDRALNEIDDDALADLEDRLQGVLESYEDAFDSAPGADDTSARSLRELAERP